MAGLIDTVVSWDQRLFLEIHQGLHDADWVGVRELLRFAGRFGNALILLPIVVAILVVSRTPALRRFRTIEMLVVTGALGLVVRILKFLVERRRPMREFDDLVTAGFIELPFAEFARKASFPSGHTTTAFAIATLLTIWAWPLKPQWKRSLAFVGAFSLAALTGIERVYAGVHYPLDVCAGAALGTMGAAAGHAFLARRFAPPGM